MKKTPPPRLALLQAQQAPIAVIFRRGPSRYVEIIRWDMTSDTFDRGHWFNGRIYDKRSDLSPDGELLVYFANKFNRHTVSDKEYTYAWTAVSRVPWLTALALWPKGDCWWGGGLFTAKRSLWLNHRPDEAAPHPAHRPKGLKVEPNPGAHGENEPIYRRRLDRDGWTLRREWVLDRHTWTTTTPDQRVKHSRTKGNSVAIVLERRVDNLKYRERFWLEGTANEPNLPPGPVDWFDWDPRGRLIALAGGRVWAASVADASVQRFSELLDLRPDQPEERAPPDSARRW